MSRMLLVSQPGPSSPPVAPTLDHDTVNLQLRPPKLPMRSKTTRATHPRRTKSRLAALQALPTGTETIGSESTTTSLWASQSPLQVHTIQAILQEVFPRQKSFLEADQLLQYATPLASNEPMTSLAPPSHASPLTLHPATRASTVTRGASTATSTSHAASHVAPPLTCSLEVQRVWLWDHKFRRRQLTHGDVFFLLSHPQVASVLESAAFLRETRLSSDQLIVLETALETLCTRLRGHKQNQANGAVLFQHLRQILWQRFFEPRITLHQASKRSSALLAGEVTNRGCPRCPQTSTHGLRLAPLSPRGPNDVRETSLSSPGHLQPPVPPGHAESDFIERSSRFVCDHCVETLLSNVIQQKHLGFASLLRKRLSCERLFDLWQRRSVEQTARKWMQWKRQAFWHHCTLQVRSVCKLRSALLVLQLARSKMTTRLRVSWLLWKRSCLWEQHEQERFAAAVAIQSVWKSFVQVRKRNTRRADNAATVIQRSWRGWFCRKMLSRRRRFDKYTRAACCVQRAFRSCQLRWQIVEFCHRYQAARRLTRNIRLYAARRHLFRSWCRRVAKFHAAALIQLWYRRTMRRFHIGQNFILRQEQAACTVQRAFRHHRSCWGLFERFALRHQRRVQAAVQLQNAFRSRRARNKFHLLKDQLELRKRQEILKEMWDQAYATRLQQWWRRRRQHMRQADRQHVSS